jgi:hypothetical protein
MYFMIPPFVLELSLTDAFHRRTYRVFHLLGCRKPMLE